MEDKPLSHIRDHEFHEMMKGREGVRQPLWVEQSCGRFRLEYILYTKKNDGATPAIALVPTTMYKDLKTVLKESIRIDGVKYLQFKTTMILADGVGTTIKMSGDDGDG